MLASKGGSTRRKRFAISQIAAHVGIGVVGLFFLFPLIWLFDTAFKNPQQIFQFPPVWIPKPLEWSNITSALTMIPYLRYVWNTLEIAFWVEVGTLLTCPAAAYAFARLKWRGRNAAFVVVLASMMLPFQVTMVSLYTTYLKLHWINTFLPLTVPAFFGNAFFIFLLRQFFLTIPPELSEAARLDGASELSIYSRVILPLARPALVTVSLFAFVNVWTDFLGPLIYLNNSQEWTISLGLTQFMSTHSAEWGPLMAASALFMIPVIILFLILQRAFIRGIAMTGLRQ